MRYWSGPLIVAVATLAGCADNDKDILPTNGPNQVVLKVPGMT